MSSHIPCFPTPVPYSPDKDEPPSCTWLARGWQAQLTVEQVSETARARVAGFFDARTARTWSAALFKAALLWDKQLSRGYLCFTTKQGGSEEMSQ